MGSLFATPVWHRGGIILTALITTALHTVALLAAVYVYTRSEWGSIATVPSKAEEAGPAISDGELSTDHGDVDASLPKDDDDADARDHAKLIPASS